MRSLNQEKLLELFGYVSPRGDLFQPPHAIRESLEYPDQRTKQLARIAAEIIACSEQEDTGFYVHNLGDIVKELVEFVTEMNSERKKIAAGTPAELTKLLSLKNTLATLKAQVLCLETEDELAQIQRSLLDEQRSQAQGTMDRAIAYLDLEF